MLTTDEIRALNEARDILERLQNSCGKHRRDNPDNWNEPDGWDYGRVSGTAQQAEWLLFSVLNELNAHRIKLIPEPLMHNREENPTRAPGRADFTLESEDDGYHLHVDAEHGRYVFQAGDGSGLLDVLERIHNHWAEGRAAAAEHQRQIDDGADAYDPDDPKHPTWHERVSDLADRRKP